MKQLLPLRRTTPAGIVRFMLAAGLALAALATGGQLTLDTPPAAVRAQDATGPLEGHWTTFANGDRINRLVRDGNTLWSATDGGGLVAWNLNTGSYEQYVAPQSGLGSNIVNDIAVMPNGVVWVATEGGLSRWYPESQSFVNFTPESSPGMPAAIVRALEATPDRRLWVGFGQEYDPVTVDARSRKPGTFTPGGLALFDPSRGEWTDEIHAVVESGLGTPGGERFETIPSEAITDIEYGSDGILWVGTEPYFLWDPNEFAGEEPGAPSGFWVLAGGGLAAHEGDRWKVWRAAGGGAGCYSNNITDLAPDVDGRMWVATAGSGMLVMRHGLGAAGCSSGQAYYERSRGDLNPGLRGNYVWAVDVDEMGRVWVGHGEGMFNGQGIGVLTHNDTFEDSSASRESWNSDDVWEFVDLDSEPGKTQTLVKALATRDSGLRYFGTVDMRNGDGEGIRAYREVTRDWIRLETRSDGLPSNQIKDIAVSPANGDVWFSFLNRGVARFDGEHWRSWRMFQPGDEVAKVKVDLAQSTRGWDRIAVDLPDRAAFDRAFPSASRYARIGDDPTLYRVRRYVIERNNIGPFLEISPDIHRETKAGTPVFVVDRGPASDHGTQIDFGTDGTVWAGGRESVWLGNACPAEKAVKNECWLDGGLGKWDGSLWTVYDQDDVSDGANTIPDQEVQTVMVDREGKVWAGTGNPRKASGDGIGVLDPETGDWTVHRKGSSSVASNGAADLAQDPVNGDVWVAHHAATICEPPPFGGTCIPTRIGGGLSKWNGSGWQTWVKPSSIFRAFGNQGELTVIHIDRGRELVFTGGYDGDARSMHWNSGTGVNAVLNWCPFVCNNEDWQHKLWPEEGEVVALENDSDGNLWTGVHRNGNGVIPPVAGVKLLVGEADWHEYTPENSGLVSNEITALEQDGDEMWVGTLSNGVSLYSPEVLPTPTPVPTDTPEPTLTSTSTATLEPTPTVFVTPTWTPEGATPPTPTPTNTGGAGPTVTWWPVYLPFNSQKLLCPSCPRPTLQPTPTRSTLVNTPTLVPTSTDAPTATDVPTDVPTATDGVPPTVTNTAVPPTDTPTDVPTATPTVPTPTATFTTVPPTQAPIKEWKAFEGASSLPRVDYKGVYGLDKDRVWFVGAAGTVLFWDGEQMFSVVVPTTKTLNQIVMVTSDKGFMAGDGGTLLESRQGGQVWRHSNSGGHQDDWRGLDAIRGPDGIVGWVMGRDNGLRLLYDGAEWAPSGPADRNTGHEYSGVAFLSPINAVAVRDDASGAKIYTWDGSAWTPGTFTGPLHDIHVLSPTQGVAVGARGAVWHIGDGGRWEQVDRRPSTGGEHLNAVQMLSDDLIWAGGGRAGMYLWDGVEWTKNTVSGVGVRDVRGMWLTEDGSEGWAVGDDGLVLRYK